MSEVRPWYADLVLAPLIEDDPFQPLAFKWSGDAASREDAIALAKADFGPAFRSALTALGAEPRDPPQADVMEANMHGRMDGARFLNWRLGPAAQELIQTHAHNPREEDAGIPAPQDVALCDPMMRRRPQEGEITWVTANPHRPRGGWGGGCEVQYHSQYTTIPGPHFADADGAVMRAIACLTTARGQRGDIWPIHAQVAPASATLRALAMKSWTVPAAADAFLRAAGLGEIADGIARCAAAKARERTSR